MDSKKLRIAFSDSPDVLSVLDRREVLEYVDAIPAPEKGEKGDPGDPGEPGKDGTDGKDGKDGRDGADGKDGVNGRDGLDGKDGAPGPKGDKGEPGKPGKNGKSPDIEDVIGEIKKKQLIEMRDIKGMPLNMNDMRWHGGGLSTVSHDDTLTGDGTPTSPLSAVASGTGTVTNFSFTDANGVMGVVTNPSTIPDLTIALGDITPSSVSTNSINVNEVNGLSSASIQFNDQTNFQNPINLNSGNFIFANASQQIQSGANTLDFPNASGTLALTSDITPATGTWYDVSGVIDGVNSTFTIPIAPTSDFLLFLARQPQMLTDDFTASASTITYVVPPDASLSGQPHKAFIVS